VDGVVLVQALVGKDGHVKDVRVVKHIPMLDESAITAVKQWVFKPALSNNKPVAVWVAVPVRFSLQ
jgi:TonB family protein